MSTTSDVGDTPVSSAIEVGDLAETVGPSEWQSQALRDLEDAVGEFAEFVVETGPVFDEETAVCHVKVGVDTTGCPRSPRAKVRFHDREEFTISIESGEGWPPHVMVDHLRFLGAAHVLSGFQLCLYLDPSREWDPGDGIRSTLSRLRDWVENTAGNKYDPNTALYHAVGGTPHLTPGTPTIVVRDPLPTTARPTRMYLHARAANDETAADHETPRRRYDLTADRLDDRDLVIPVIPLRGDLPIGAGSGALSELFGRIEVTQGLWPRDTQRAIHERALEICPALTSPRTTTAVVDRVRAIARKGPLESLAWACGWSGHRLAADVGASKDHEAFEYPEPEEPVTRLAAALIDGMRLNPTGAQQYALVAVPHPGGGSRHLICLRVPAQVVDVTREALAAPDVVVTPEKLVLASGRVPMEWCRVSDERGEVTIRRDVGRPVGELVGKTVHVWGTGGIGSWIAEWVVRAGVGKVVLHDPGCVTGGLLVRQDFVEADVGLRKDRALATRLRAMRDDVEVELLEDLALPEAILEADLLIDATINRAVTRFLDDLVVTRPDRRTTFAQIATDTDTGTLGIAIVAVPGSGHTLTELDTEAGAQVKADPEIEDYRVFWNEPSPGSEFVPTRGCSIPTFHGSAADLAGVSGALLNFICLHLASGQSGTHLMALPQSGVTPSRRLLMPSLRQVLSSPSEPAESAA